ncbi:MAG: acetolactate synthase catalytic subunit [Lachnospiraceae bacterium]
MPQANFSKRVALALKRHGVTEIFGQSNPPTIMLEANALGIRQIGYRQENTGTYMAHGYSMGSEGRIGVMAAQNGPAATLVVAGLAECQKASIPIVALVQDVGAESLDRNAFQEIDHARMFESVSKWVKRIPSPNRVEDYVDMAFVAAASGRPGPVVLLLPGDFLFDPTEHEYQEQRNISYGTYPLDRVAADPAQVKKAAELLAGAERPFIYAGGGVISSQACEELRAIQEECSIPVATSTMGKSSVDELHPLSMGPIGYYMGNRGVSKFLKPMVQSADVILLVGNRTNQNGTDAWTLLPRDATYIHIDIDPMEVGRNYESVRVVGDAKLTLTQLKDALAAQDLSMRKNARAKVEQEIAQAKAAHAVEAKKVQESDSVPLRIECVLAEVEKQLSQDHIIVADASLSSVWLANYIKATEKRKFIFPRGIAGLGWGMPMAMGAKVANPNRPVFCLAGDGGFGHVWSELETCKREKINVVTLVINNEILGYQKHAERSLLKGAYTTACDLTDTNLAKVAEAVGVKGIRLEKPEDITSVIRDAFAYDGSVVIDAVIDPDCIPPLPFMDWLDSI